MARRDIRDVTPLGIKAINDNFIDLSYEVFGTASFTKKVEKQVAKNTEDIETFTRTVSDLEGSVSEFTQTAESIVLDFDNLKIGGRNYFGKNTVPSYVAGTGGNVFDIMSGDSPNGFSVLGRNSAIGTKGTVRIPNVIMSNGSWVVSFMAKANVLVSGVIDACDSAVLPFVFTTEWQKFEFIFEVANRDDVYNFVDFSELDYAYYYINDLKIESGTKGTDWTRAEDEMVGVSHTFDKTGYTIKDSTGAVLITPNGMANEQNFGSTQNVEDGYPLNMSFEIGDTTSVITSVKLKLRQYNFRTDSKGAASGGGATSGDGGSWSSTVGVFDWTQGLAADTSGVTITSSNLGIVHAHTVSTSKLGHRHSVAVPSHQHSTPAHAHPIEFGILELFNDNGTIEVDIDGIRRTGTVNTLITLDITPWVSTSGVHTISLRSPNKKRIQCDVFIKSYIRR